ncbi:MAG TPA: hypothetical protein PKA12_04510 [Saprospiraceae bacterium]|nr:hypothetical protein [Saprospiraceae bacterium]
MIAWDNQKRDVLANSTQLGYKNYRLPILQRNISTVSGNFKFSSMKPEV